LDIWRASAGLPAAGPVCTGRVVHRPCGPFASCRSPPTVARCDV